MVNVFSEGFSQNAEQIKKVSELDLKKKIF